MTAKFPAFELQAGGKIDRRAQEQPATRQNELLSMLCRNIYA